MVMAAPDAAPGGVAAPSVRELNQDPRNLAAWEAAQKQYQDFMENEFELTPQAAAKRVMLAQKVGQLGKIYREGTAGEKQLGELEARKYAAAAAENQLEEAAARKAGAAGGGAMFDTNAIINAMREDYERQKQMKKES